MHERKQAHGRRVHQSARTKGAKAEEVSMYRQRRESSMEIIIQGNQIAGDERGMEQGIRKRQYVYIQ